MCTVIVSTQFVFLVVCIFFIQISQTCGVVAASEHRSIIDNGFQLPQRRGRCCRPSLRLRDNMKNTNAPTHEPGRNSDEEEDAVAATATTSERIDEDDEGVSSRVFDDNQYMAEDSNDRPGILRILGSIVLAFLPNPDRVSKRRECDNASRRKHDSNNRIADNLRNEAFGGVKNFFKDAPAPIRAAGNICQHLISQSVDVLVPSDPNLADHFLEEAHALLRRHPAVGELLGTPISLAPAPFEERHTLVPSSTSSSSPEERRRGTTRRIESSFTLSGSREAGVAFLSATNHDGIQLLRVTAPKTHRFVDIVNKQQPNPR